MNILDEDTCPLAAAAKLLPRLRGDRPISVFTMHRWVFRGVRARSGQRVTLEAVKVGGRWTTSRQAIRRFVEALSAPPQSAAAPPRTANQRSRANERASQALTSLGL